METQRNRTVIESTVKFDLSTVSRSPIFDRLIVGKPWIPVLQASYQ